MILGIGTDIVKISRINKIHTKHGDTFAKKILHPTEYKEFGLSKKPSHFLAKRFAAKEAVMKTLGTGWTRGVGWQDIEVQSAKSGQPSIAIHGGARDHANQLGIDEILITISHCRAYATATAIAVSY